MSEQFASVNDIELCYETFGDSSKPAVLLIMGLGGQMIWWEDDFCAGLVDRGFHVIRFDNRDCGRSTVHRDAHVPKPRELRRRDPRAASYSLDDMAGDAAGLLDHLGISAAHVVGVSMGGMIAQTLAIRHPQRVLSLCSISSTTGDHAVGKTRWRLYPILMRPLGNERERYMEGFAKLAKATGSRGRYAPDMARVRELAGRSFDRGVYQTGTLRQLAAILSAPDRTRMLGQVGAPTLVIHGGADRLCHVSGGKATARAIPDAKLVVLKRMAHDMPRQIWPRMLDEIAANATRTPKVAALR
jgi:pimeloyl-ACP methyl ester carboxylesterase